MNAGPYPTKDMHEALKSRVSAAENRLSTLEGRAMLDTEAVQDIIGQMFGEVQGHYDDASGTYTVTFPEGTTVSDQHIQDVIAAMVTQGQDVTIVRNPNGTLTISAAGGGTIVSAPDPLVIGLGDSIMLASLAGQSGGAAPSWLSVLAGVRGWTMTSNGGVDGSTLATGGAQPISTRLSAIANGFNGHVVVAGGVNDHSAGLPLGRPGDTTTSTIYGALRTIVDGVMGRCGAQATLHLVTPTWRTNEGTRQGSPPYTLEQVRQAIRDEAARGARLYPGRVQLLDAGRDLADLLATPGNLYLDTDGLHPTRAGQDRLGWWAADQAWEPDGQVSQPSIPAAIAEYNMQQGTNAGVLYAQAGPNGVATGTWSAAGLIAAGGTGATVDLGAALPRSGQVSLTLALTLTDLSAPQMGMSIGNAPSTRGNYDTLGIGVSGVYPNKLYGFLFAAWHPEYEVQTAATAGHATIVTLQYDWTTQTTTMFVDGQQVSQAASSPALDIADTTLHLGYWRPATTAAMALNNGTIHWARVDRLLSAAQVQAIHANIHAALTARGLS